VPTPTVEQMMAPYTDPSTTSPATMSSAMLGEWGMNSPVIPPEPDIDPLEMGMGTSQLQLPSLMICYRFLLPDCTCPRGEKSRHPPPDTSPPGTQL